MENRASALHKFSLRRSSGRNFGVYLGECEEQDGYTRVEGGWVVGWVGGWVGGFSAEGGALMIAGSFFGGFSVDIGNTSLPTRKRCLGRRGFDSGGGH